MGIPFFLRYGVFRADYTGGSGLSSKKLSRCAGVSFFKNEDKDGRFVWGIVPHWRIDCFW